MSNARMLGLSIICSFAVTLVASNVGNLSSVNVPVTSINPSG